MGVVDRKLAQGQGPSSLITLMQLQREQPRAFDISFILVFCSFVLLSLCRLAAGMSIITSCLPELYSMSWQVRGYREPFSASEYFSVVVKLEMNIMHLSSLIPFHLTHSWATILWDLTGYLNSIRWEIPKLSARMLHYISVTWLTQKRRKIPTQTCHSA